MVRWIDAGGRSVSILHRGPRAGVSRLRNLFASGTRTTAMTILVSIDGTEQATEIVSLAHELATKYDVPLAVLHVIPEEDYEAHKETLEGISNFSEFTLNQEVASAKRFAQEVAERAVQDTAVEVEARGRVGDMADETLAEATQTDPEYLVIGGRRRSPTGKAVFGDSTQKIILKSDCPVVTKMGD